MAKNAMKLTFYINTSDNDEETTDSPTRRTTRVRKQPKKYGDFVPTTPTKRSTYKDDTSDEEMEHQDEEVNRIIPTALFSEDDVGGQDMFKFKTRHTKVDLQNVVEAAISNTPSTPSRARTPGSSVSARAMHKSLGRLTESTPKHVNNIIKKRIIEEVESESEYSAGSSDDFLPDGSGDESASSQWSGSEHSDKEQEPPEKCPARARAERDTTASKQNSSEYYLTPDNYFIMNSTKKIQTSDHTLARLNNLSIDDSTQQPSPDAHQREISQLVGSHQHLFSKWLYVLSENYNIIVYGIGSKRSILQHFQADHLQQFPCVVVNGFFPSLNIKNVLESIVIDLLGNSHIPSNIGDTVDLIDAQLRESAAELFLIVHNIDGPMLRNGRAQAALASLARLRNVHMIASLDHINAPLLWDNSKLSKLMFTWWECTSFLPYTAETMFEREASAGGGELQLASLRSVYRALNNNARDIFHLLVHHQLHSQNQHNYQGLPFKELYRMCRERFLVSCELALRAQLTEFLDHRLLRARRDMLHVPLPATLLRHFLQQQDT